MKSAEKNVLVLVTGANGFVGSALLREMRRRGIEGRAAARCEVPGWPTFRVGNIDGSTSWSGALQGCDAVVHLAARVHVMDDRAADPLAEFRKVNVDGTENLARQAVQAGVRRFIYVSSIKVNGERTRSGHPFTADDQVEPTDAYGQSKAEAEARLQALARETGLEVVIIRPVLVYGPGVKANFLSMMRWLKAGLPLPLGAIDNARSLVAVDNLVDLILVCLVHPAAANQVLLASDGEDLSTPELLRRTAAALGTKARLLPVPAWLLQAAASLAGKSAAAERLCGSLHVDIEKTTRLLGWTPPVSVDRALRDTAESFLSSSRT
jgi:UDP-glucose 4-epimerase